MNVMNVYVFDLDDTLIIHESSKVKYHMIKHDVLLDNLLRHSHSNKKYIYTNGTLDHALVCIDNLNMKHHFKRLFTRTDLRFMKPYKESFEEVEYKIKVECVNKEINIIFFDDQLNNLETAKTLNWTTIWIHPNFMDQYDYVDFSFPNIYQALLYFAMENDSIKRKR